MAKKIYMAFHILKDVPEGVLLLDDMLTTCLNADACARQ